MTDVAPPKAPHEKFLFGTVFDPAGGVVASTPRPKRNYSAEEVEAIRNAAHGAIQIEASTEPTHSPPPRHAPHAKKAKFHKKQGRGKKAE